MPSMARVFSVLPPALMLSVSGFLMPSTLPASAEVAFWQTRSERAGLPQHTPVQDREPVVHHLFAPDIQLFSGEPEAPLLQAPSLPESQPEQPAPAESALEEAAPVSVVYGEDGFNFSTRDQFFSLAIQNRIQSRYANPFDRDPRSLADLQRSESSFMIRRARTKFNGHAYWPWLKYYLQYDWKDPILRDLNLTVDKYPWARLWVGRGKVIYNDERVTSSGKQQFVNRSIVNDLFTVDRQQGLQLSGHLFPGTWHDLNYAAGVFSGLGVNERNNDDLEMMYAGRLQWNMLGGSQPFSQSDLARSPQPSLSLALAAATNQSRCTAFATGLESCRSLPGFSLGEAGQYRLNQMVEELRFRWQGLAINQELHWKEVRDRNKAVGESGHQTQLLGGLLQVGYFPHALLPFVPQELELAGRYAFVDPNRSQAADLQQEFSGVLTYFFHGHANKLSLQFSHLMIEDPVSSQGQAAQRLWLQWDISF